MAKAKLILRNGTEVSVEGSPSEVAAVLAHFNPGSRREADASQDQGGSTQKITKKEKRIKTSPTDLILSLAESGFFKTPKDLTSIKEGLAEIGHIYPIQTLSSIVFKMVRRRYLRRLKEEGRWVYLR